MSAQAIGQWAGLVIISVTVGAIGFGLLQIVLSVRDYFRRRAFYIEASRKLGESIARNMPAPPANLTVAGRVIRESRDRNGVRVIEALELSDVGTDPYQLGDLKKYGPPAGPFELMMASPPCEPFRRGEYPRVVVTSSRKGGKTEAQRLALLQADTLCTPYNLRPYLFGGTSYDSMAVGLIIRQATKSPRPPGEIAIGVALDLERDFLDGDRPTLEPPRGIFHQ